MSATMEYLARDKKALSNITKLRFFPLVAVEGHGCTLTDIDGREYLDMGAGWAVASTGYSHPRITRRVTKQMEKLSFSSLCSTLSVESIELAERLCALLPGDFAKKAWYGHSGSDANELLSKMLPLATGRPRMITYIGSYHGQTLGSCGMSGHPAQSGFITGAGAVKIPYPYCYRCAYGKDPATCKLFCARHIEDYVLRYMCPADQVGALVAEPVQSDGGDVTPPDGYFEEVERICRRHGIWLIFDEVKVGYGRTGKMFGFEHYNVTPDAVVLGKPMGSGQPLSAVVGRVELMDAGLGNHLFTTAGNPVACAAGLETLDVIRDEGLISRAAETGAFLKKSFEAMAKDLDCIGDVRGRGMIVGIELVTDRKNREPAGDLAAHVVYRSYELGLIHFAAGIFSNVLEFTPPLVMTREEAERAVKIVRQSIEDAVAGRVDSAKVNEFAGWGI